MWKHGLLVLPFLCVALLWHRPMARAGEQEWVVAPSVGYAVLRSDGHDRHGGILYLDVDYGLTDSWSLRGNGHYSPHAVHDPETGVLHAGGFGFGVLYTVDVLKVVPYLALTVGPVITDGTGEDKLRVNGQAQAGIGLDYLVSRDFSVGLELRAHVVFPDIKRFPLFLGVAVRLAWRHQ